MENIKLPFDVHDEIKIKIIIKSYNIEPFENEKSTLASFSHLVNCLSQGYHYH